MQPKHGNVLFLRKSIIHTSNFPIKSLKTNVELEAEQLAGVSSILHAKHSVKQSRIVIIIYLGGLG